ncbi:MAG: hypothetical protein DRQ44_17815 [Gammaproteobacteria bacterium]|nr:MAG: hypothetical protein DRQ44_17815 [Gammaproteobacteria bacterium]
MDKILTLIVTVFFSLFALSSIADTALGPAVDCAKIEVQYIDNPEWTHSERVAAMDRAFFDSLEQFELCNLSSDASGSNNGGSGQEQGQGLDSAGQTGDYDGETGQGSAEQVTVTSTKNTSMSGTEVEITQQYEEEIIADSSEQLDPEQDDVQGDNGARPEDIPDGNNDDVVAAQIRRAAEIEQDPVKKQKLWNEYRKYKGLPVKNDE